MDIKNSLMEKTGPILGAFCGIPSPPLVEILGLGGFDFVIIDTEHGVFDLERIEDCLRSATSVGMFCMVRVPELNPHFIQAALDMGANGVQVPQVETADEARKAVEYSHFPPLGTRGFSSTTRAAGYGFHPRIQFIEKARQNTVICIQIESRTGVENLGEILKIPGVDIVFIGPSDLSLSYQLDTPNHPKVYALLEEMIPMIVKAGKTAGIFISDWAKLSYLDQLGVRYFTVSVAALVKEAFSQQVQKFAMSKVNKLDVDKSR